MYLLRIVPWTYLNLTTCRYPGGLIDLFFPEVTDWLWGRRIKKYGAEGSWNFFCTFSNGRFDWTLTRGVCVCFFPWKWPSVEVCLWTTHLSFHTFFWHKNRTASPSLAKEPSGRGAPSTWTPSFFWQPLSDVLKRSNSGQALAWRRVTPPLAQTPGGV